MFNDFNLSDDEIIKIINDYKPLILKASIINDRYDEDLAQVLQTNLGFQNIKYQELLLMTQEAKKKKKIVRLQIKRKILNLLKTI